MFVFHKEFNLKLEKNLIENQPWKFFWVMQGVVYLVALLPSYSSENVKVVMISLNNLLYNNKNNDRQIACVCFLFSCNGFALWLSLLAAPCFRLSGCDNGLYLPALWLCYRTACKLKSKAATANLHQLRNILAIYFLFKRNLLFPHQVLFLLKP